MNWDGHKPTLDAGQGWLAMQSDRHTPKPDCQIAILLLAIVIVAAVWCLMLGASEMATHMNHYFLAGVR